jgi:hypothetical protein
MYWEKNPHFPRCAGGYSSAISACEKNGQWQQALQILQQSSGRERLEIVVLPVVGRFRPHKIDLNIPGTSNSDHSKSLRPGSSFFLGTRDSWGNMDLEATAHGDFNRDYAVDLELSFAG